MATKVNPIPEGFHTVSPHLICRNAAKAIDFYKKAFNAEELVRMPGPDGKGVMHAELRIGNSIIMLAEEMEGMCRSPQTLNGTPVTIHLYVQDCDKVFKQAVSAGANATMPPADMFWGDRYGKVTDPFGHEWSIGTHVKDLSPEEMQKAMMTAFKQKSCGH
ncbi:MAG: VOC family protein [Planctomycetota bacterium]